MKVKTVAAVCGVMIAVVIGASGVAAKTTRVKAPVVELNATGQQLAARYEAELQTLKAEIAQALPKVGEPLKASFVKVYHDEAEATKARLNAMRSKGKIPMPKAEETFAKAAAAAKPVVQAAMAQVKSFLASDKLDGKLVKCVVLTEATPQGLAGFAQQSKQNEALVEKLLADSDLMKQMVAARGAEGGKYGEAMKIYTDILKASDKAGSGNLQRLAVAVAIEHAVPITQRNPTGQTDAPATVDPVKRYLAYEKAFLAGELDPGFKDLTVWEYRNVVNGQEPDWTSAWGRQMLHNYRPDEISTSDYRWRYVKAVKTEVKYGSQDNKYDKPELQFYQNIIMNGGVCGRRAFFGRFILRAFGIPTTARPQRGHATLVHWTPKGWVICLGATWGWGWTKYGQDVDFLSYTQARATGKPFTQVLRAKWAGLAAGEDKAFGFCDAPTGFWNGVALYRQRQIVEDAKAVAIAAVGTDIGEANESKEKDVIEHVAMTDADKKVTVGAGGVITIPAVACSKPTKSTGKILFMKSDLGGMQLHYGRLGKAEPFEYTFNAPAGGKYALTARVVTTSWKQHLLVAANGAAEPTDIAVPFTVGMWDKTKPVEVTLVKGKNVLTFTRPDPVKGLTIKDFTLTPVR